MFKKIIQKFYRQEFKTKSKIIGNIYCDDLFLVSYPKSGNTWVRFFFANLLKQDSREIINFHNVHDYCPEWKVENKDSLLYVPRPRVIKSHAQFISDFPRVLYIVRDPKDVYVSYYNYLRRTMGADVSFELFLSNYDLPFGTWSLHVKSWLEGSERNSTEFKLIRYEDLIETPSRSFSEILNFSGITVSSEKIRKAIDSSNFKNMQKIENNFGRKYDSQRVEKFVRKGEPGEWKEYFREKEIEIFSNKESNELIQKLGYKTF